MTCDNDSALALLLVAQTMSLEALFANSIHLAQLCFGSCSFLINCPRSARRPGVSLCQPLPVTFLSSSYPLTSFYFRENLSCSFWSPPWYFFLSSGSSALLQFVNRGLDDLLNQGSGSSAINTNKPKKKKKKSSLFLRVGTTHLSNCTINKGE